VDIALPVAIGAILTYVGECRLYVARHALHFFMHGSKGVAGLVVVELRDGTNGPPTCGSVTILTGYC